MPRAGLADAKLELLRAAVADEETVARFRAKIVTVPGLACSQLWSHAVAGRGHGRFWLGTVQGRGVVIIAHRFSWALTHGVDSLVSIPLLGHRCDNPLCQVAAPGHVEPSSAWRNRQEWLMRRHTIGGALRDTRGARGRAHAVRDALRADPSGAAAVAVMRAGLGGDLAQLPLWPTCSDVVVEQGGLTEGPVRPHDLGAPLTLAGG